MYIYVVSCVRPYGKYYLYVYFVNVICITYRQYIYIYILCILDLELYRLYKLY